MKQKILIILIILCSLLSGIIWAYIFINYFPSKFSDIEKENTSLKNLENIIVEKIRDISPSVVSIIIKKDIVIYKSDPFGFFQEPIWNIREKIGGWTGFFIRKDGTIITNKHVISDKNALYTVITDTGKEYDAIVIAVDPINDLAIIKINSKDTFLPLNFIETLDNIKIWQFALAIGNALAEFQNSVSLWIISWKERNIKAWWEELSGLIQTDTAINPWNSWWPLVNLNGKVMGINTAIVNNSYGIWFAIALTKEKVAYILKSIEKYGEIKRPFIWINYIPNSPSIQEKFWLPIDYGAYIIDEEWSIIKWSSADKANIQPWDIIIKIGEKKITQKKELGSFIQNKIPWKILKLTLLKKSWEEKIVELELWEY